MQRIYSWFAATFMLFVYIAGVAFLLYAMAREACAAEFSLDIGKSGQIRIFDKPCFMDETKMGGYLLPKTGNKIWACWIFKKDKVHLWFQDGSYLSFPWADMHPVIDGSEYAPPRSNKRNGIRKYIEA